VVTFGGLGVSAILALFVVPLLYYYWEVRLAKKAATENLQTATE
jgi:Cu/Ag efflux pump CusA